MSRVGKLPIAIPSGVTITVDPDNITVAGSKGTLKQFTMPDITVKQEDDEIIVTRANDEPKIRAKHGLMRALSTTWSSASALALAKSWKSTVLVTVSPLQGTDLKLNLGFSHDVIYKMPAGVTATVEQNTITVSGISKQQVGQVAAEIRALKKPEPYKGKGIKYEGERIIRKSGKSGKDK